MSEEVNPKIEDQEDIQEFGENDEEEVNPLNQAMEEREDSNEVQE